MMTRVQPAALVHQNCHRLAAAGVALLLCVVGLAGSATGATDSTGRMPLRITGFQSEGDPPALIDRSRAALTTVGVDGVNLDGATAGVGAPDADALRQLARAHRDHLRAELLVGNFDSAPSVDDFSEPLAFRMLSRPASRAAVVAQLAIDVGRQGWDGISIDLESLSRRDRGGLVAFVQALRAVLPPSATVSVNVENLGDSSDMTDGGYDLAALGAVASRIILMAYDEHGPWENTPGPVGSLRWTRAGLATLLAAVPASKVDLGVAGYGYAWEPHQNVQLSDAAARALVSRSGGHARWVATVGEWTAHLPDGSTLWWSDARSLRVKARLAAALHLHGLAIWSLGLSDPLGSHASRLR